MVPDLEINHRLSCLASSDKKKVTSVLWIICITLAFAGLFTPNPFETALCCLIWPLLFSLLWQLGETPILLFAASFQVLQVITPVITANLAGKTLQQSLQMESEINVAFYLSMLAILVLALGMKVGLGNMPLSYSILTNDSAKDLKLDRLLIAYIVTIIFSSFIESIAFSYSALTQLLLAISSIHWFVVFFIFWSTFRYSRFRFLTISVAVLEVVIGLTGFFSGFKFVLLLMLVIYISKSNKASNLFRPQILALAILIISITSYWQAIKPDYRNFMNLGSRTQTVQVSLSEQLAYHRDATSNLNEEQLVSGLQSGLDRLGYIKFFAGSLKTVPYSVPYQNGKLWYEAILNLRPRFLFPDKPIIDDSIRTNTFSGFFVAGADKGTSVSIGYVAESYIDFGIPIMFLPIFALGYFWSWFYKFLLTSVSQRLLGMAAGTVLILNLALYFESSNIKIIAGAVSSGLVYFVVLYFFSNPVWKWLTAKSER